MNLFQYTYWIYWIAQEEAVKLGFWHPNQYQIYTNQNHVKNKNKSIFVDIADASNNINQDENKENENQLVV